MFIQELLLQNSGEKNQVHKENQRTTKNVLAIYSEKNRNKGQ